MFPHQRHSPTERSSARCAAIFISAALLGACVQVAPASSSQSADLSVPRLDGSDAEDGGVKSPADLTLPTCASSCPSEGATQCDADGHLQTCMKADGSCLAWSALVDCATNQICCGSACVPANEQNCWVCGTVCGAAAPLCSPTLQRCGCTPQSCAATQHDCSDATGTCVACVPAPVPETRTDFYVDANAAATPTGSEGCPYQLITDALTAAQASSAARKTIHVAPGTYASEIFPIPLRGGISLIGAGATKTIIQGQGAYDAESQKSQLHYAVLATVIIGSDGGTAAPVQTLSGVTLLPGASPPVNTYGLLCDRGSALPRPTPAPSPNVTASGLTIGPGYSIGILETNSNPAGGADSGCNLLLTGSTITGEKVGIWALGAGLNNAGDSGHDVALQLGDNTAAGSNHFTNITDPTGVGYPFGGTSNGGTAMAAWDGVTPLKILRNTFDASDSAVLLAEHPPDHTFDIENNTISVSNLGIGAFNGALIDTFSGNVFNGIGGGPNKISPFGHSGLGLAGTSQVRKARNNQFVGNEIGVEIMGNGMSAAGRALLDFGTSTDAGGNTFSCNSNGTNGADVYVHLTSSSDGTVIHIAGDSWDHASPSTSGDGADLLNSSTATAPTLDASSPSAPAAACPAGKSP